MSLQQFLEYKLNEALKLYISVVLSTHDIFKLVKLSSIMTKTKKKEGNLRYLHSLQLGNASAHPDPSVPHGMLSTPCIEYPSSHVNKTLRSSSDRVKFPPSGTLGVSQTVQLKSKTFLSQY